MSAVEVDAERIIAEAQAEADRILVEARAEADELLEGAEQKARERSDVVINETQTRLDALLAVERDVRARLEESGSLAANPTPVPESQVDASSDARDVINGIDVESDSTLADFMKSTLRHEVRPE